MKIILSHKVVNRRVVPPFGININYLRDADENRSQARPLSDAIAAAGMRHLRYPGGSKSDAVLHMTPPFDRCVPQPKTTEYIRYSQEAHMMDFDKFMEICRRAGCEPHVVVGCDTFERRGVIMEEYLDNAIEWVRYANIVKGYRVKYWEIGNENWNDKGVSSSEFGKLAARFSQAMKAIDPSILIGASGDSASWWEGFLPEAVEDIDFLTVSQYSCWGYMSYDTYANNERG